MEGAGSAQTDIFTHSKHGDLLPLIGDPDGEEQINTHNHPDHNIELGTLIYFAWYAGLTRPLGIYGPPPSTDWPAFVDRVALARP